VRDLINKSFRDPSTSLLSLNSQPNELRPCTSSEAAYSARRRARAVMWTSVSNVLECSEAHAREEKLRMAGSSSCHRAIGRSLTALALIFFRELRELRVRTFRSRVKGIHARARAKRCPRPGFPAAASPSPSRRPPRWRSLNVENVLSYPWLKLSIRRDATARRILIAS